MGLITFLVSLFEKTLVIFSGIGSATVDAAEAGMRQPLQHLGLGAPMQTLLLAMVPLLTLIAGVKLLRGVFRIVLVVCMVSALLRITWPLVGQVGALA